MMKIRSFCLLAVVLLGLGSLAFSEASAPTSAPQLRSPSAPRVGQDLLKTLKGTALEARLRQADSDSDSDSEGEEEELSDSDNESGWKTGGEESDSDDEKSNQELEAKRIACMEAHSQGKGKKDDHKGTTGHPDDSDSDDDEDGNSTDDECDEFLELHGKEDRDKIHVSTWISGGVGLVVGVMLASVAYLVARWLSRDCWD
mmetsp:Transcript_27619/g.43118  ORF Transcript_27619/g.43118 Transcript_27619/m.43118 type:complete len:201 (-) Transcript_27619:2241-2843(-)